MAGQAARQEPAPAPRVRIGKLSIEGYKAIDQLSLELPGPRTPDELDAFVLGSQNGVGKTSVLECCALLMLQARPGRSGALKTALARRIELLQRSGSERTNLKATIVVDGHPHDVTVDISGKIQVSPSGGVRALGRSETPAVFDGEEGTLDHILGLDSEPLVQPPVLFFNSFRKVVEGSAPLGAMVDPRVSWRSRERVYGRFAPISTFKIVLIQALMARSGMFEPIPGSSGTDEVIDRLNGLVEVFAGGHVEKVRPGPDGTLDLRVAPVGGGASFSFDGLSSGQKEIISTLFLVWLATRDTPGVVLIDEPELHLNPEWQRLFVHQLQELAPQNQYILATHAEEIFASVPEERRLILRRG